MKFAWPLAKGVSRPSINHPHLIHKSTNRFFIFCLLDLSSIPRAREGAPGGPPAPKSVGKPWANGRKPPLGVFWRHFWAHFRCLLGASWRCLRNVFRDSWRLRGRQNAQEAPDAPKSSPGSPRRPPEAPWKAPRDPPDGLRDPPGAPRTSI